MFKKSCVLGLLSVAALTGFSLPSFAGEAQVQDAVQVTNQTSAVIGDHNSVLQDSKQILIQQQQLRQRHPAGVPAQSQGAYQNAGQATGVVGHGNAVGQFSDQVTIQKQQTQSRPRPHHHRHH